MTDDTDDLQKLAALADEYGRRYEPHEALAAVRGRLASMSLGSQARTSHYWMPWMAVAAALLMVVGVSWGSHVWHTHASVYATTAGQRLRVTLSDGTRVTLAPESRLRLAPGYEHGTRAVSLTGEAYFAVIHDVRHPFSVLSHDIQITDVGTEFDVRAYDANVRVAVRQGEVSLLRGYLTAGDVAETTDTGFTVTHHADIASATAWLQGRLVFNSTPLPQVVRELSRTFDLEITVRDSALARQTVTGSFDIENANEVLYGIASALGAEYDRDGRRVVIRQKTTADIHRAPGDGPAPLRTARANVSTE